MLKRSLLIIGLVSGLVINYQPHLLVGIENPLSPDITLAQNSTNSIEIESIILKANNLDSQIGQLNQRLKSVVNEEIDREEIDFESYKQTSRHLQESWEAWKQSSTEEQRSDLQDTIDKIDNYLGKINTVLTPLKPEIIPTLEEFQASPEIRLTLIQELQNYQVNLFGKDSNTRNSDGIFGSGTQTEIESVLVRHIKEIKSQIRDIKIYLLQERISEGGGNQNQQAQIDQLQRQLQEKERTIREQEQIIERLQREPGQSSQLNNNSETRTNPINLPDGLNVDFLVPLLIITATATIVILAYVKWNNTKIIERKMSLGQRGYRGSIYERNSEHRYSQDEYNRDPSPSQLPPSTSQLPPSQPPPSQPPPSQPPPSQPLTSPRIKDKEINLTSIRTPENLISAYNNYRRAFYQELRKPTITEILSVDKDSVEDKRAGYDTNIIFNQSKNGNYFIFLELPFDNSFYYLLPKPDLKINKNNYETINEVFECKNYSRNKRCKKFTLKELAIVMYKGNEMYLQKPGIISIN